MKWGSLAACLLLVTATPMLADAQKKPKKTGKQLRRDLSSLAARKAVLRKELLKARSLSKGVHEDIGVIDERLDKLEGEIDDTKTSLARNQRAQIGIKIKLAEATKKANAMEDQVRARIRYIYMHQGESVISSFIGVKSVGEIASRKFVMESVAKKDRALFDQFEALQAEVQRQKHASDVVIANIRNLKERQLDYQAHMEVTREDKVETLNDLRARQDKIQTMLADLVQDENSIQAQIQAYEAAQRSRPDYRPSVAFNGRFLKPARGPITSGFGMRFHPILHRTRLHAGIDFGAPYGSAIVAAADGVVITAHYSRSFGNMVVIDHGGGLSTLYAHGSRLYVSSGQRVKRGQRIAAVGNTGLATGPHLHWEVRRNGRPVNPAGRF